MVIKIDLDRLSANLYLVAEFKDLSLSEIARRAGVDRSTIDKIFRGKSAGNLETFLKIASALETVNYNKLLEGVVKKND